MYNILIGVFCFLLGVAFFVGLLLYMCYSMDGIEKHYSKLGMKMLQETYKERMEKEAIEENLRLEKKGVPECMEDYYNLTEITQENIEILETLSDEQWKKISQCKFKNKNFGNIFANKIDPKAEKVYPESKRNFIPDGYGKWNEVRGCWEY